MNAYKKVFLINLVREHKRKNVQCQAYSKMNKSDLYQHVLDLGLLQPEEPAVESDEMMEKRALLNKMAEKTEENEYTSDIGMRKKNSLLRRIARTLKLANIEDVTMDKIISDYNKLLKLS